jgi:o-succinylbenzoate synthase
MDIRCFPYTLDFSFAAGTSRGVLHQKTSWFLHAEHEGKHHFGECGLLKGLSLDDRPDYELQLKETIVAHKEDRLELESLTQWPSIRMGWETLLRKLSHSSDEIVFESDFLQGTPIDINGLVWMGKKEFMLKQIAEKIDAGFSCVKMKIGAIDIEDELDLLHHIRSEFSSSEIELRVDANGAFRADEAMAVLQRLAELEIHSIEQPIAVGQWDAMARLCEDSPIPIALDEELIAITDKQERGRLLTQVKPAYIILKPSLLGGFASSDEWISHAEQLGIGWWATSALESNVGLSAIAQWCATKKNPMPQGLGTGSLYLNNVTSPLVVKSGQLRYRPESTWNLQPLLDA